MKRVEVEFQGEKLLVFAHKMGNELWFHYRGKTCVQEIKKTRSTSARVEAGNGEVYAQMPGKILKLEVKQGDTVSQGQKLLVMEAMKMEHTFYADFDGEVSELNCKADDQVSVGQLLVKVTPNE